MKKTLCIFIILSGIGGMVNGQSSDKNFIKKRTYISNTSTVYVNDVEYYDGLGRPFQSVSVGASPVSGKDMVTLLEYDGFNRESKSWLPVTVPSSGAYVNPTNYRTAAISSAGYNDPKPYAEVIYEASTLNRVSRKYDYGAIFRNPNASTDFSFMSNGSAAPLNCLCFYVTGRDMGSVLAMDGLYPDNKLYVNKTSDPDSHDIYEFVDFQGRTILSRAVADENGTYLDTYYVYDIYGNLSYVLPPELSAGIISVSGMSDEDQLIRDYAFIYKYDDLNRLISRKMPGKEAEYFVYDKGDRLILSQDGQLRAEGRWLYNVYDRLGRIIERSIVEDSHETPFTHSQLRDYYAGRTPFASNDPDENINILMPMGDDLFVVIEHIYSCRYGGQSYEVMIEPEQPRPYSPTYEPFVEGKYFFMAGFTRDGGPGLNIIDPDLKYFTANNEVRPEYFIASEGSKIKSYYYYIPKQYLSIVENTIAASDTLLYFLTDIFPLDSEPLTGWDPDPNPTLVYPEPLYINFLENQYLAISENFGRGNVKDPHGMYFTGEFSAKDKYFIGYSDYELLDDDGNSLGRDKFYYIPEHCQEIIHNTIAATSNPLVYRIFSDLGIGNRHSSYKDFVPKTGIINFTPEWKWVGFEIPPYLKFDDVAGIVSSEDVICEKSKGKPIYDRNAVIGSSISVERAYYYDYKGRTIQTVEKNHLGGISRYSTKYDFVGNILTQHESVQPAEGAPADILTREFSYDHRGRLLSETAVLNGGEPACVTYGYDELGRLQARMYGSGNSAVTDSLKYNIQGWLTEQSGNLFEMKLHYYDPRFGTAASYTGNITEWEWQHKGAGSSVGAAVNTYTFDYDMLSQLTDSRQYIDGIANNQFVERGMDYDKNGNILSLKRYGSGLLADDFTYNYSGNKLVSLGGTSPSTYEYDSNGNCIKDGLNGLEIGYNYLNLTERVRDAATGSLKASYTWLADGTKCGVVGSDGRGFEYLGSLVYIRNGSNLTLESAVFGEGRIIASETSSGITYSPNYFITDHLGSVRAIVDESGQVLEQNDYYPFGMNHQNSTYLASTNRYQFSGKELQTTGGLGYLDYGARMYDARLGRWHSIDPLAESYTRHSPFHFSGNNPLRFIDLNGMWYDDYFNRNGFYLGSDGALTDFIRIIDQKDWDQNKTSDKVIDHNTGKEKSKLFSESGISESAELKVYDHYNYTGVQLVKLNPQLETNFRAMSDGLDWGAGKTPRYTLTLPQKIGINLERNRGKYDNFNNIISSFDHEQKHLLDARADFNAFVNMSSFEQEQRAIQYQFKLPAWGNTTLEYQNQIMRYWYQLQQQHSNR